MLPDAVTRRMLGDYSPVDVENADVGPELVPTETRVGEQVRRLRESLDQTVRELGITPARVKRVVDTALVLARQQPLRPHTGEQSLAEGLFDVPTLVRPWERAAEGLTEKSPRPGELPRQLPVTFDAEVARGRRDVVLAHLNSPLVTMSTRLLRAAVSSDDVDLHRVTAVVSDDPRLEDVLVGAYSRFLLVGNDGVRLHEEVLYAGGWAPEQGRFRRLENLSVLGGHLQRALTGGVLASAPVRARLAQRWPRVRDGVLAAIDWRTSTRRASLEAKLAQRQETEQRRIVDNFTQFAATLRNALNQGDAEDALFSRAEGRRPEEVAQFRRDRANWEQRLTGIAAERDRELAAVAARYRDPRPHRFPVAVVFVVPKREATR